MKAVICAIAKYEYNYDQSSYTGTYTIIDGMELVNYHRYIDVEVANKYYFTKPLIFCKHVCQGPCFADNGFIKEACSSFLAP